jgi:hypothetical protein
MREPCHSSIELKQDQSPYDSSWKNCRIDYEEPMPLNDQQALEDYKKLCAPLYKDEKMPLCCSANQIFILKKDLAQAEALIGSCASCYLNFRMLWCHLTCDPNQHEFLVVTHYERLLYNNFTNALLNHQKHKILSSFSQENQEKLTNENEEYPIEDDAHDEIANEMKPSSKHLDQLNEINSAYGVNDSKNFIENNQEISNYDENNLEPVDQLLEDDESKRVRRQVSDNKAAETQSFVRTTSTRKTSPTTSKATRTTTTTTSKGKTSSVSSSATTTTTTTITTTSSTTTTTSQDKLYMDVVSKVEYHVREEFMIKLIDSCK